MNRLSMHIMKRMIVNFIVLFMLFYLLGAVIDIIVNLDEFDKFAAKMSQDSGVLTRIYTIIRIIIGFEGPRLFQVFAYLHGVIAIGAMAFTAASMSKSPMNIATPSTSPVPSRCIWGQLLNMKNLVCYLHVDE